MRAKDSARLTAIRMLTAAIKQKEVDERIELSDAQVLAIVEKQIKQRRDSIAAYKQAQRQDLVEQEQFEADVLAEYLPLQLGESEIIDIINAAKASTGASSPQDIGKLMAVVKPQLAGKADMSRVSALVKAALAA
jgi:uncharacterized protein YqeY